MRGGSCRVARAWGHPLFVLFWSLTFLVVLGRGACDGHQQDLLKCMYVCSVCVCVDCAGWRERERRQGRAPRDRAGTGAGTAASCCARTCERAHTHSCPAAAAALQARRSFYLDHQTDQDPQRGPPQAGHGPCSERGWEAERRGGGGEGTSACSKEDGMPASCVRVSAALLRGVGRPKSHTRRSRPELGGGGNSPGVCCWGRERGTGRGGRRPPENRLQRDGAKREGSQRPRSTAGEEG